MFFREELVAMPLLLVAMASHLVAMIVTGIEVSFFKCPFFQSNNKSIAFVQPSKAQEPRKAELPKLRNLSTLCGRQKSTPTVLVLLGKRLNLGLCTLVMSSRTSLTLLNKEMCFLRQKGEDRSDRRSKSCCLFFFKHRNHMISASTTSRKRSVEAGAKPASYLIASY